MVLLGVSLLYMPYSHISLFEVCRRFGGSLIGGIRSELSSSLINQKSSPSSQNLLSTTIRRGNGGFPPVSHALLSRQVPHISSLANARTSGLFFYEPRSLRSIS